MKELKLGTVGSGVIVQEILDNVQRVEGIRLEAVYSRSQEKGRALAESYGAHKVYTDMDAFLGDGNVDAVYIATPNLLHYEQAKQALLAGKHVICEKPFCIRGEQVRALMELAKEKRLLLVEAVPTTFLPNFQVLKENLSKIGPVKLVLANYSQYSARYDKLLAGGCTNIFDPNLAGGCLMDINYYNVYLTAALFGRPEKAVYYPNCFQNGIDTSGIIHLSYPSFAAALAGAKDARGINYYQIEGERGFLYIKDGSNGLAEVRVVTKDGDETVNLQSNPNRWFYEVQELSRLFRAEDYEALQSRGEITLAAVETVEQARKAAGLRFPGDC